MFTGLVQQTGRWLGIARRDGGARARVACAPWADGPLAPGESVTVSITGYSYTPGQATTVVLDEVPSDVYTYELKSLGGNDYEVTITAKEEGFDEIAELFLGVAAIEKEHEERYRKLLKNIEDAIVFSREGDCIWQCGNCGHIVIGPKAPEVCPVCNHPQAYFQLKAENY